MKGLNKVQVIGVLGQDPDVRFTSNNLAVAKVSVAVTERWKNKQSGEMQEKTEWVRIVIFGQLADIVGKYLRKGSRAYFEGKMQTNKWEKDGVTRYTTEVNANDMIMLDSKPQDGQSQGNRRQQAPASSQDDAQDEFGDDIPF